MSDDPCGWTVRQMQQAVDDHEVSAVEVYAHLAQRAGQARGLNSVAHDDLRFPTEDPRPGRDDHVPPLRLVPLLVKDSIDTADFPTTAGTGALAGRVPSADAPVVERLRAAGAVIVGKATMHELSYGVTSDNAVTGTVRNPYDPARIPGGSSGGTAVAVAAGTVPAGLGADTGGSVRLPAALCGVVGFRPTVGRYPGAGVVPLSHTRDTVGPIARCVADVRTLDTVMAARAPSPPRRGRTEGVRLGVPTQLFGDLEHDVERVLRDALTLLTDAGVALVEVDLDDVLAAAAAASPVLVAREMPRDLVAYLGSHGYDLTLDELRDGIGSRDVRRLWDRNTADRPASQADHARALASRDDGRARYRELMDRHDVAALVQPTAPLAACPVEDGRHTWLRGRRVPTFATYIRHTDLAGALGLPGISLPAGRTEKGLPVGLELEGRVERDEDLLSLAALVEALLVAPVPPDPARWRGW